MPSPDFNFRRLSLEDDQIPERLPDFILPIAGNYQVACAYVSHSLGLETKLPQQTQHEV